MIDIAIRVENLSKQYRIGTKEIQHDTLMSAAVAWVKAPLENFRQLRRLSSFKNGDESDVLWALRDVSFTVRQGEVIAIIGRNGAGKSTLLKILSRITPPSSGRIILNGRVASLLEVGTGFHPELTGRENIYLNGTILGMTKTEIEQRFDEIVDFSGVEKFIDTPVKRYSSGMKVRLAFSVAAHLEPEILLVDEVLAVGDAEFQRKSMGKMSEVARTGRTILFVSHSMPSVQSLCPNAILLEFGEIGYSGESERVIARYINDSNSGRSQTLSTYSNRAGTGEIRFIDWVVKDELFGRGYQVRCNEKCSLILRYVRNQIGGKLIDVHVAIVIKDSWGQAILTGSTEFLNAPFNSLPPSGEIICTFDSLPLMPDNYQLYIWCKANGEVADLIENAGTLHVVSHDVFGTGRFPDRKHGRVVAKHFWEVQSS